jgi:DNA (cytosine-5)-methyltransferase 1
MVRAGLGDAWECLFAKDIGKKKRASYARNWGTKHLIPSSVGSLTTDELPERADLAWPHSPVKICLSRGDYIGLKGERSGTFWLFGVS